MTTTRREHGWRLSITSWRGISLGAVHWYGRLIPPLVITIDDDGSEHVRMGSWSNQLPDMRVERKVRDRAEFEKLFPDHKSWTKPGDIEMLLDVGEMTDRFDTKQAVISRALDLFTEYGELGDYLEVEGDFEENGEPRLLARKASIA